MAFIRKVKTKSGATAIQIAHKEFGRIVHLEHIGSAHNGAELDVLVSLARQRLQGSQESLFSSISEPAAVPIRVSLRESYSDLLFQTLTNQYNYLGLDVLEDPEFSYLTVARIVEPTSKLDSLRVLSDLGATGLDRNRLYRCLSRVVEQDYRTKIASACFDRASSRGITLVLYDVTTLYFEIQKEDEYRKPGLSKERRLEPQVVIGLLVDQTGFPLGVQSFEGNTAETATILPVMEQFRREHNLKDITVVADAGMLSAKNLEALAQAGYSYIVGSRLGKIPYGIAEYQKTGNLTDGQIITAELPSSRIIYQYKEKRAVLDTHNIEKQIAKAERIASGKTPVRRAKFLSLRSTEKKLNHDLINKAYALVGIKGYVTNLKLPGQQIIDYYHQLFKVEASFRMAKTDLKARPIFHHKRDSIEAHLTVVFAALAIARTIESRTGTSIKQFVKTLRPIRSGTVVIHNQEYKAEAEVPPEVRLILEKLN